MAASKETQPDYGLQEALRESEVRYRTLFDSIDEGFCVVEVIFDAQQNPIDYRFLETNPSFDKQTGLINAQGRTIKELVPQHEAHWFEIYGAVALTGEPVRFQHRAEQLHRWYDVYAFRVGAAEQRHVAILFNDISERRRAEDEVREREDRLRMVIENLAEGLIVVNPHGAALHWNQTAVQMHGYDVLDEELKHFSSVPDLFEIRTLEGLPVPVEEWPVLRLLRGEDLRGRELVVRRKADGWERILSYGGTLVRDKGGEPVMGLLTIRDVTELKKAQAVLVRNEKLASVGRMAATIAHEINNPLAAAMNLLYLVSETPGMPDFARANLELAERELRRIAHITKQTLGFYREGGKPTTVPLPSIVDGTLDLYAPKLVGKSARIERRYRGPSAVYGIEGNLRQVVSNLISNSIDALPDAGTLHVRTAPSTSDGAMVRLTVADTGIGIRPENLKQIFEPFFTTKESVGTGLGLWVTRELIKKNGGKIRIRSRFGRGTVVSIWLNKERRETGRDNTAA
jgi:PAS domain S-box-containing protein